MITITVPRRLTFETASNFACELGRNTNSDEDYVVDFSHVGRVEPFALLYLSSELQRFGSRVNGDLAVKNIDHMTYADLMGFFRSFNVDGAKKSKATGNESYIPITIKNVDAIRQQAAEQGKEVGDIIENSSKDLARILSRSDSGDLYDTLVYSFTEIIRNVVEHSNAGQFGFCAQYWPSYQKVEAAIIDRGDGIRTTLSNNPTLKINDDREALNFALFPGISGKAFKGAPKQTGYWANAGFGLYMTSRIARQGGSFFIASGRTGMYLSEDKRRHLETPFQGVALNLSFNVSRITKLNDLLKKFRHDAYQISDKYKYGENLNANTASVMLRSDFQNNS